ncbi:3,4-dihydroxy-2-butanone-4-phosphate synthase [Corynebacterium sp. 320]|uniref:3,4-dihydroxy-2-butanone-4-phosphate synthase n=1 Tax=Corynebacterium TaxID=1716 RepID=UPI00125CD1D2|nr:MULTISPECIES: 3,4-dihydroxy-2-butanone-4-phosphate synthase [Corynebacterium]KAB1504401.1 3,4-dihydroxy-2-butanone-4-phosphate synthase [Corynebacterium sp. 320]KAB1552500.1 3,4-dihydroxy-2-butanone-4-phosphate synthase [Corynebacterium sp. 321]KAB1554285.1 3,4-dihydroxy-2-butanone-4-phosphate synthase [Corynebacterium sp. 319]KAB3528537.1 3,4-dihydroxy-2-butanone-4-phosphate synthase [Corynebacterium sp. 250]KAB3539971.1 3,4-dihydroxy-2-butanone-4-phosphate synthase [Corynebacterium sp. 36
MPSALANTPQAEHLKTDARRNAETLLSPIEDIVADIAAGKMVVLVDDEDRENEGDLIMAAEAMTPESVNFMITHGKGLLCAPMTAEHAAQLNFAPMVHSNEDDFGTAFTVSCDATADFGVTTGISAADRATTISLLASGGTASSFHRPGHVFPLIARHGGVLARIGHTEAGSDLAAMAGFSPVAAIIEIIGDDGEMLRLPELVDWCGKHNISLSTIERLRTYRQAQVEAGVDITQRPDGSALAGLPVSAKEA